MKSEGGTSHPRKKFGRTVRVKRRANTNDTWEPMPDEMSPNLKGLTEVRKDIRRYGYVKIYYEYEEHHPKPSSNITQRDLPIGWPAMTFHQPASVNQSFFTCPKPNCGAKFKSERSRNTHLHMCGNNQREFFCVCGFGPFRKEKTFNNHKLMCDYTEEHLQALTGDTKQIKGQEHLREILGATNPHLQGLLRGSNPSKGMSGVHGSLPSSEGGGQHAGMTTMNIVTPSKDDTVETFTKEDFDASGLNLRRCHVHLSTNSCHCTRACYEQLCQTCQQPINIEDCIKRRTCGWSHSAHSIETTKQNLDAIYKDLMDCSGNTKPTPDFIPSTTRLPGVAPTNDADNTDTSVIDAAEALLAVARHGDPSVTSDRPSASKPSPNHCEPCALPLAATLSTNGGIVKRELSSPTSQQQASRELDPDLNTDQDDSEMDEFGTAVDHALKEGGTPAAKMAANQIEKQQAERYMQGSI